MTKFRGWDGEDLPYLGGRSREFIEQLIAETDLPPPDRWDAYDVFIDREDGSVTGMITADGIEHTVKETGIPDLADVFEWDWALSVYDWIQENWPDVDLDVIYE